MNKFSYFKKTFLPIFVGLFVGIFVYGLFDIDFSNNEVLTKLLFRSFVTAITTGLVLGILNMFFKIDYFQKKEH